GEHREEAAVDSDRGLDDVGDHPLLRRLVEVGEAPAAALLVGLQVVVAARRDALDLPPAEGVEVLDVGAGAGVVGELFLGVVAEPQVRRADAEVAPPPEAELLPVREPFAFGPRHAEELALHLLELAHAEELVADHDLVPERAALLRDAEGDLDARRL